MKKILISFFAALSLGVISASAMDAETLISHPERYRVVYTTERETAYADMESLSGMQTMDFPSSLENVDFTLYVETYKDSPDAMDFENRNLISHIREFRISLLADKRENHYEMDRTLLAKYDAKGATLPAYDNVKTIPETNKIAVDAKSLYIHLKRAEQ